MAVMTTASREASSPADVDDLVRKSGTSFYWAMRFLPLPKRRAMFAVYAFCREVDDIADEPGAIDDKRDALQSWRERIDALYAGSAQSPIAVALQQPVETYALRRDDFLAIIDGMEMDAAPRVRIRDQAELLLYCDRVASAVGRLSVRIFGLPLPTGDDLALSLGQALQLTNILRDLKEDANRDRLYLPAEMLSRAGVNDVEDAERVLHSGSTETVCRELASLAERRFAEAKELTAHCSRRDVRPAVVMMEVYHRTFRRLMERGWGRWAEPVHVSPAEKLWVAVRHGMM